MRSPAAIPPLRGAGTRRRPGGRTSAGPRTAPAIAAVAVLGVLVARTGDVGAVDLPPLERRALDSHLSDLTNCLAYYSIAQLALERAGEQATAARVEEIKITLLDRSFIVMRAVGLEEETALARQTAAMREHMALIDDDLDNFATLTEKYGTFCKDVVEDPEDRIEYWKERQRDSGRE